MEILIHRKEEQPARTFGELFVDGVYFCDTLEDTDRHLEDCGCDKKVYGKTAIPRGEYKAVAYFWKKHGNYYLHLLDVPCFSGILIHGGVTENDSLGCILVGKREGNRIVNSSNYMQKLRKLFMDNKKGDLIKVTLK